MYMHKQTGTSDCNLFAIVAKTCLYLMETYNCGIIDLDDSTISHSEHSTASGKNQ